MKKASSVFISLAVVFMVVGLFCIWKGFDYKNNYYNFDSYSSNAYVGGDAYNYIINGTYFDGYVTMAMGSEIIASIFLCFGVQCHLKVNYPPLGSSKENTLNVDDTDKEDR